MGAGNVDDDTPPLAPRARQPRRKTLPRDPRGPCHGPLTSRVRFLGIDFGERRIGLAISDDQGRVAVPLGTLRRRDDRSAARQIGEIARREGIDSLVIGEPLLLDGSRGTAAARVGRFVGRLESATGLPCELVAETLTSAEAERRLRAAGVDPRRQPERVDAVAAQILLQEALDRRREPERR